MADASAIFEGRAGEHMNQIERLMSGLVSALPAVKTTVDRPANPSGTWWVDIELDGHSAVVEWRPSRGFGVSASVAKVYGDGPDEVFDDVDAALDRLIVLLREREFTHPPRELLLRRIRNIRRVSQKDLAAKLGVNQATVSKIERQSDMYLSTLRRLIAAMGGALEIRARFPEGVFRITQFEDLEEDPPTTGQPIVESPA
jgi:DNA-binding XRE family transcriptional regulator